MYIRFKVSIVSIILLCLACDIYLRFGLHGLVSFFSPVSCLFSHLSHLSSSSPAEGKEAGGGRNRNRELSFLDDKVGKGERGLF